MIKTNKQCKRAINQRLLFFSNDSKGIRAWNCVPIGTEALFPGSNLKSESIIFVYLFNCAKDVFF